MNVEKKVPEIRFKGFSGEWEDKKLAELAEIVRGASPRPIEDPKWFDSQSSVGWLRIRDVTEQDGRINYLEQRISKLGQEKTRVLHEKHLLLSIAASVGKPVVNYVETGVHDGFLIFKKPLFELEFMYQWLKSFEAKWQKYGQPGSQVNLNSDIVKSQAVTIPTDEEQTTIGTYFQKLDSLISQHQQKHDKLSSIKKAMLEKMFPKQGETVPEIRFKGFSGEWEEKLFRVCFVNVPNNTLSRADLNYNAGLAKNIHYGDVLIKFGEVLDVRKELLPFITNDGVANKLNHAALRDGDIIIADAAEDSIVGKCTELFNIDEQLVLSGLHTIAVRPTLSFASKYLGYYLNSSSYHDQLLSLMQGTKVLSISKTAIQNTSVTFPKSSEEQTAIGNYFQKLDELINQHQQQITKLNNIKQACLSKMFV